MKFVFDLDGTICFKGQPVTEKLLCALEELAEQGHEVIFASARPIRDLLPVLHERFHRYPMIGGNGSMVASGGSVISVSSFGEDVLDGVMELLQKHRVTYLVDSDWDYAYTGPEDHPILHNLDPNKQAVRRQLEELRPIMKILMLTSDNMEEMERALAAMDIVVHVHTDEGILDVCPTGIDKWSGLCKLGVSKGEYIAFGNDANDISMFRHARHTVMIGEHPMLAPLAVESLQHGPDLEDEIVLKLRQLGQRFLAGTGTR